MAERFGVVVAIGLTFFGLMLIAAQDVGITIGGGGVSQDKLVLTSTNFGEVGGATTDIRTSKLGTFNIGEGRGQIRVYRDDKVDISNGLFSGNSINFEYNATQPTAGSISLEVLGKEGDGAVYVEVNGKRIFEEQLVTTATETINISGDDLKTGINTFKIGTTKGGFISSTKYALEDFEATVTDRKFNDHVDSFQMYEYELKDFVGTNLSFNIPTDNSVVTEPLKISVNDNEVFSTRTVRSEHTVSIPKGQVELHPGYNTIKFETDADAQYKIENAQMTVRYVGITRSADKELDFNINQTKLDHVNREDTSEYITFDYQILTGNNQMFFKLGSFNTTISPTNGQNKISLPEDTISEQNQLQIESEGSFTLNNFKVISEVQDR